MICFNSEFGCIQFSLILLPWDLGRKNKLPAESNGSITLDNKWYGNCKKRGHCRLNFLHCMKAHSNISLVYTKYGYRLSVLGGPIALHGLVHFPNTTGASLTKVVYAYFDGISYTLKGFPKRKMHLFNRLIILWWCFTSSWGFVIFALSIPVGDTRTPTHDTKIGYQRKKSRQNHHLMLHWMVKTMVSCDFSPKSRPNKVKSMPPKVLRCDSWSYRSTAVGEKHMQAMGQNPVTFRMKVS